MEKFISNLQSAFALELDHSGKWRERRFGFGVEGNITMTAFHRNLQKNKSCISKSLFSIYFTLSISVSAEINH